MPNKVTRKALENIRDSAELASLAEELGYGSSFKQLTFHNGASASSLLEFFDDNPGAIEAVVEWIGDQPDLVGDDEEEDD